MIRPRGGAGADPLLVTGVLGAAAALRRLRALVAELAADGDRCRRGAAPSDPEDPGAADAGEVVDVVLGLAALAAAIDRRLPVSSALPGVVDPAAELRPINLLVKELLR